MSDKTLQIDLLTLPIKYIALCEFTASLMGDMTAHDIDKQIDIFIKLTEFQVEETPEEEVHLNG